MIPVGAVLKDFGPLDPPGDDVMQSFGFVSSWFSWHAEWLTEILLAVNCKTKGRP